MDQNPTRACPRNVTPHYGTSLSIPSRRCRSQHEFMPAQVSRTLIAPSHMHSITKPKLPAIGTVDLYYCNALLFATRMVVRK